GDAAADEKLSIYTSSDGLNFALLSRTGYGGPTNVLRDPSIMKHTDGKYYIAYTLQSWTTSSTSFGIASSTDLKRWTFLVEVPAGVAKARDTWAPEWFVDGDEVHLIVNIDTLGNDSDFRSYDFKAKDSTLTSWDAPVSLGIGPNNIDTFVVKQGATYHAFSKNETTKFIEHATANALHGPWDWIQTGDFAGWGSGKEGIALFKLDDGRWRMFLDCYSGCGFLYADSSDLSKWSKTTTVPGGLSGVVRHGTVLREDDASGGGSGGVSGLGGASGRGGAGQGGTGQGGATSGGTAGARNEAGRSAGGNASGGASGGTTGSAATGGRLSEGSGGTERASGGGSSSTGTGGATSSAAGGASSAQGGASAASTTGGSPPHPDDNDASSGCAVRPSGVGSVWSTLGALGVVLAARLRRTRRAKGGARPPDARAECDRPNSRRGSQR
ncbi:MAG TPA: glycoside hydrolase family 43 protein, partial [Polyangiaceae bacterium]|nr:glycoside hydrolase family 43 protein [Polyangiaceae bacterium]